MSQSNLVVTGVLAAVSIASAQSGYVISVDYHGGLNALTPTHPACTVRVHAAFPSNDHAFAAA